MYYDPDRSDPEEVASEDLTSNSAGAECTGGLDDPQTPPAETTDTTGSSPTSNETDVLEDQASTPENVVDPKN